MLQLLLSFERPKGDEFDGGFDFVINGYKGDAKTMGRTVFMKSYYVHNFMDCQSSFNTDAYIFSSFHKEKNILTVCGWLFKEDFMVLSWLNAKGTLRERDDKSKFPARGDLREVTQELINPINSIEEFRERKWIMKG